MWCPKCRNEYREGIRVCADCGCELVESLEVLDPIETAETQEPQEDNDITPEEEIRNMVRGKGGLYQKTSEKAEDFKSSAYVLLGVGAIGLIVLVMVLAGLFPIQLTGINRYMTGGVLGIMFAGFLIMGIQSFRSSKILLGKAKEEDELTREIMNWCRKNLSAEQIDEALFQEDETETSAEEAKYFKRVEWIHERITAQFLNLEENYVEQLIEEYYQEVYITE